MNDVRKKIFICDHILYPGVKSLCHPLPWRKTKDICDKRDFRYWI